MKLTDLREALGISQKELDRLAGLSENTVYQIEAGKNKNPGVRTCVAIVAALRLKGAKGTDIESLFAEQVIGE